MNLIKTPSFELAVYQKGNLNSSKLALILPGKLDTKDYSHLRFHTDFLAARGYLAVSFDPPGTWESPGDISLYTMTNYLKAINELVEYFENRPTLLVGHSRGGGMATLAGTTNSFVTHFVSIMGSHTYNLEAGGTDATGAWKLQGYSLHKRDIPGVPNEYREFKLPYSFYEDQAQYNLLENLRHCAKPKLFISGKNDVTVEPWVVKTAFEAAAPPKELAELDSDHNYRYHNNLIEEVNFLIGNFLDKYSF